VTVAPAPVADMKLELAAKYKKNGMCHGWNEITLNNKMIALFIGS
jgi:hypothetical protein